MALVTVRMWDPCPIPRRHARLLEGGPQGLPAAAAAARADGAGADLLLL